MRSHMEDDFLLKPSHLISLLELDTYIHFHLYLRLHMKVDWRVVLNGHCSRNKNDKKSPPYLPMALSSQCV